LADAPERTTTDSPSGTTCSREMSQASGLPGSEGEGPAAKVEVSGIPKSEEELNAALDKLPRFNIGAMLLPMVWGPAHGFWVMILLYPVWVFVDSQIRGAVAYGGVSIVLAALSLVVTIGVSIFFSATSGKHAYLRVAHKVGIDKYLRREKIWAIASIVAAIAVVALATFYNIYIYDWSQLAS
jgi:hypothetical protein